MGVLALSLCLLGLGAAFADVQQQDGAQLTLPEDGLQEGPKSFDGYSVLRAVPLNPEGLRMLKEIADDQNSQIDFWKGPSHEKDPVDMMVSPQLKEALEEKLKEARVPYTTLIQNVEQAVQEEKSIEGAEHSQAFWPIGILRAPYSTFFNTYQRVANQHNFLDQLAAGNPSLATTFIAGRSTEGRNLKGIKISSGGSNKPAIWIDGGIHAREWISSATVLYITNQLVQGYGTDASVKQLVDKFDWYILPMVNPDGYEFTHTSNRLWRKTRSRNGLCYGTDPNRNYGFHWMEAGASTNPCSDVYGGPKPFSEPETKAVSDFVMARKDNIKAFLTVHSYSQLWLTPWGWTNKYPQEYSDMKRAADVAVAALTKVHGTRYTIGSSTNVLYAAAGGADDWAHGTAGIKYSYTLELRDTGRYGFVLPANQIVPTGAETWEGVKALANHIAKEY